MIVSAGISFYLASVSKKAFLTFAVLKVPIVTLPKLAVQGGFVVLDSEHALALILTIQGTVWNKASVKLTMRATVSWFAVAGVRLGLEIRGTGSSVGAEDLRVSALDGSFHFTELSDVRDSIMLGTRTVAIELVRIDLLVDAHQTFPTMVTVVIAQTWALFVGTIASEARPAKRTLTVITVLAKYLMIVKRNPIDVHRVHLEVGLTCFAGRV